MGFDLALIAVVAEVTSGGNLDFNYLLNFGVLGLFVIALLVGVLWPKPQVERIIKEKEAIEAQRDALLTAMQEQVIPVLTEFKSTAVPAIKQLQDDVRSLTAAVVGKGQSS